MSRRLLGLSLLALFACEGDSGTEPAASDAAVDARGSSSAGGERYGSLHTGGEFHLGPVDFEESAFHNACAAERGYAAKVRAAAGDLLAGVWGGLTRPESLCDTCVAVHTNSGKDALLRVVTYGDTTPNSLDVSPQAYALLNSGEYPRDVSWQLAKCADSGPLMFEFKSGSNPWWTAFWVRNGRVRIAKVEVMGAEHAFTTVSQASDGSFVDDQGVGMGAFSIRVTGVDGQTVNTSLSWPSQGLAGQLVEAQANFR